MKRLDLAIKTLFAEFQEACFQRTALEESVEGETFVKKEIKGKIYWYAQHYEKGKMIQKYFGPSNPETDKQIIQQRGDKNEKQKLLREMIEDEKRRSAMLRRGGLPSLDSTAAEIIEKCSSAKMIDGEGVLIGSYAFAAYSGILGVLFEKESLRTLDIDIVPDRQIEVVTKQKIDWPYRAVPTFSHKSLPSSFIGPGKIRIDLLTPLQGKEKGVPNAPRISGAGLQPLRFLDFLIESPIRTILIGPGGGIPVTIPHPVRFAIHKLIVSTYRPVVETAKKEKDLMQADQLIQVLAKEQPTELKEAYREAVDKGRKWKAAILKACLQLPKETKEQLDYITTAS